MTLAKAHKTGRKIRRNGWHKFRSSEALLWLICISDAIADDWEVEPEVYEVECTWQWVSCVGMQPMTGNGFFGDDLYKKLKDKRTKVTIEVLPD